MTTWTMEQVHQVERLYAEMVLDGKFFHQDGINRKVDIEEFSNKEMGKQLVEMGHPLGVEMNPQDFEVVWYRDEAKPWAVIGKMRWQPKTNIAELRGGHLDGTRYALRKIGDPFKAHRPEALPWKDKSEVATSSEFTVVTDIYELVGWREDERVWVYQATT